MLTGADIVLLALAIGFAAGAPDKEVSPWLRLSHFVIGWIFYAALLIWR